MKRITKIIGTSLFFCLMASLTINVNAQGTKEAKENLKAFPEAMEGMVRHIIELPKKSDESIYKVEIIPGKTMSVDCNNHRLMGKLTEKDVQGWGYTYYEFTSDGRTASTMMACNEPSKVKFVGGQGEIVRYNSRLPIVVYTPAGFEVKYRIWKAGKEQSSVKK